MAESMELITVSRLKAARRCLRFHCYSYELCRAPIESGEPLMFGTVIHDGQEQWWLCWMESGGLLEDPELPLSLALGAVKLKAASFENFSDYDLAKAIEVMRGYHYYWFKEMEDLEVLGVESQFEMPLINPRTSRASQTYRIGGKIDVRVRRKSNGEVFIVEHKTTSTDISPESDYWTRLRMDGQISQYLDGARSLGDETVGCIYDVMKKPGIRPYKETPDENKKFTQPKACKDCQERAQEENRERDPKAKRLLVKDIEVTPDCPTCEHPRLYSGQHDHDETVEEFAQRCRETIIADPDSHYRRMDVKREEEHMRAFRYDTWLQARIIRDRQLDAREFGMEVESWPCNPDACDHFSRRCEYYGACTKEVDIMDDHVFMTVKQHSELNDAGG